MPTMPFCQRCLRAGTQSRLKRIYYRLVGKYSEIGWLCPSCLEFTLDKKAYADDMNLIFGLEMTEDNVTGQIIYHKKRNDLAEKLDSKKSLKLGKIKKETHPDDNFAE